MGKALRLAAVMTAALLFAAIAKSDVAADETAADESEVSTTESTSEPVVDSAIQPAPGSETEAKDPFAPYGIGPVEEAVPYEALSPEEQAVADRGRDTAAWSGTHSAFAAAVGERSHRARAESAQHQLGVDSLETTGVIE